MRAGVVLPPSYGKSKTQRYPTVYVVHGYGGNHLAAWRRGPDQIKKMSEGKTPEMIYVYLDASFSLGHHVFADSVNNGPWGHALTSELIPYLEKQFRMDAIPRPPAYRPLVRRLVHALAPGELPGSIWRNLVHFAGPSRFS